MEAPSPMIKALKWWMRSTWRRVRLRFSHDDTPIEMIEVTDVLAGDIVFIWIMTPTVHYLPGWKLVQHVAGVQCSFKVVTEPWTPPALIALHWRVAAFRNVDTHDPIYDLDRDSQTGVVVKVPLS